MIFSTASSHGEALREFVEHLEVVAEAARQLKSIRYREAERDIQRWEKFIGLLERIADAKEAQSPLSKRRTQLAEKLDRLDRRRLRPYREPNRAQHLH